MWRQGDVLIQAVDDVPDDAALRPDLVLAEGELTGHMHRVDDLTAALLFEKGDDLFLKVTAATATVVHDEHGPVTIKQGVYRVWRQREYSPDAIRTKRTRWVRD